MKKGQLFLVMLLSISFSVFSQQRPQPPVSVELLFGNNKSAVLMAMNKQIVGPLRYSSITSVSSPYDNAKGKPELLMINSFIYQLHPNLGAGAGLQYHFLKGLVPSISLNASYSNPVWLVSFLPFLNMRPDTNTENVAIVEFKPSLNEHLKLYSYAMALYNHNITLNYHDRSFYYFRLGLTAGKFTVGAAANFDYYGPNRLNQNNYGGFVKFYI